MNNVNESTDEYNSGKDCKILIIFDGMITDMIINKKLTKVIIELFIHVRKLNIFLVFIVLSYFTVSKKCQIKLEALFY